MNAFLVLTTVVQIQCAETMVALLVVPVIMDTILMDHLVQVRHCYEVIGWHPSQITSLTVLRRTGVPGGTTIYAATECSISWGAFLPAENKF